MKEVTTPAALVARADGLPTIRVGKRVFTVLFPDLVRPLTERERQDLKNSIRSRGVLVPVVVDEHNGIIDGINRATIAAELKYDFRVDVRPDMAPWQKVELAIALNADRRHLSVTARRELVESRRGRVARARAEGESLRAIAAKEGVSEKQVRKDLSQSGADWSAPDAPVVVRGRDGKDYPADRRAARAEKRLAELHARAEAAPEADGERWRVIEGDCTAELARLPERPRLIFADPPYNQGMDYGDGYEEDRLPHDDHRRWLALWVKAAAAALADDGTLVVLSRHEIHPYYFMAAEKAGLAWRNTVTWHEGFGQNTERKFARVSRPVLVAVKGRTSRSVFNAAGVLVPSARQEKYNDRRAVPCGKVMGDVWDDVPRLAGTHKERIPDFPTQLPVALVARIVTAYTGENDLVCDPFSGSATTGEAALTLGRRYVGIEKREQFAALSRLRLRAVSPAG